MTVSPTPRKVFQGVADRHQMFRMFDRHAQRSTRFAGDTAALYAGEWFEIAETEHDYMFEILPPLWIRGSMFAMCEFLDQSVTSVFFALRIEEKIRHFHAYCDLSDHASVERMRIAIIDRESRPARAMTREERLEHIWSTAAESYRGYAGERWPASLCCKRTVVVYGHAGNGLAKLLDDLDDNEVASNAGASTSPFQHVCSLKEGETMSNNPFTLDMFGSSALSSGLGLGVTAFCEVSPAVNDDEPDPTPPSPSLMRVGVVKPTSAIRRQGDYRNFYLDDEDRGLASTWKERAKQNIAAQLSVQHAHSCTAQ